MPGGWVLIVEDDAGLARTVAQVLRTVGVSAMERADSVPAALALASRPGLVAALVDVWLPGGHGNGVGLAVELRRQHPKADIVVWSDADDIALVHEAHAARFDFITKGPGSSSFATARDVGPTCSRAPTPDRRAPRRACSRSAASARSRTRRPAR